MIAIHIPLLLQLSLPEIFIVIAALLVLMIDIIALRTSSLRVRFSAAIAIASAGCVGAIFELLHAPVQANLLNGMLIANPLTQFVQIALLVLTILALLLSVESTFTEHVGEYVLLVLLATAGMMFLVATQDILIIFLSLELLSLSLYILTAFDKRSARSAEAALKYFLFGGMSAAILLFGFSLLYGLSNSTLLAEIARASHGSSLNSLLAIAIVTTVVGFGFKVAAAPFHFWAPDVYDGAPAPSAGLIASSSKVASFFVFFQVMTLGFSRAAGSAAWLHFLPGWVPVLAMIATLSMVLGNLAAIAQSRARRMLAYSAIAHAGYMLLIFLPNTQPSLAALLYYVVTYALATLGAFGVVAVVEKHAGDNRLSDFDGLSQQAPVLSACMMIFLLSLAGIPPLAGFFGKFYLFASVLQSPTGYSGLLWLVILAIAMSAVSLYYYLRVLKRIYVAPAAREYSAIHVPALQQAVLLLLAAAVVLFGCAPQLLLRWILEAVR